MESKNIKKIKKNKVSQGRRAAIEKKPKHKPKAHKAAGLLTKPGEPSEKILRQKQKQNTKVVVNVTGGGSGGGSGHTLYIPSQQPQIVYQPVQNHQQPGRANPIESRKAVKNISQQTEPIHHFVNSSQQQPEPTHHFINSSQQTEPIHNFVSSSQQTEPIHNFVNSTQTEPNNLASNALKETQDDELNLVNAFYEENYQLRNKLADLEKNKKNLQRDEPNEERPPEIYNPFTQPLKNKNNSNLMEQLQENFKTKTPYTEETVKKLQSRASLGENNLINIPQNKNNFSLQTQIEDEKKRITKQGEPWEKELKKMRQEEFLKKDFDIAENDFINDELKQMKKEEKLKKNYDEYEKTFIKNEIKNMNKEEKSKKEYDKEAKLLTNIYADYYMPFVRKSRIPEDQIVPYKQSKKQLTKALKQANYTDNQINRIFYG